MPKVHNIRFILAKIETELSLVIDSSVYDLADSLSAYYLNNRYPDFAGQSQIQINGDKADYFLKKTKEVFTWLLTLKK